MSIPPAGPPAVLVPQPAAFACGKGTLIGYGCPTCGSSPDWKTWGGFLAPDQFRYCEPECYERHLTTTALPLCTACGHRKGSCSSGHTDEPHAFEPQGRM